MNATRGDGRRPPRGHATQVAKYFEVRREDRYRPAGDAALHPQRTFGLQMATSEPNILIV